jgi:anti-anti-sigma factor
MNIKVEKHISIKTIAINGRVLVTDMKTLEKELENIYDFKEIHIDLTNTDFADSSFLGLMLHTKGKHPEIEMKMINPNEFLMALFDIPELKDSFTIITTE